MAWVSQSSKACRFARPAGAAADATSEPTLLATPSKAHNAPAPAHSLAREAFAPRSRHGRHAAAHGSDGGYQNASHDPTRCHPELGCDRLGHVDVAMPDHFERPTPRPMVVEERLSLSFIRQIAPVDPGLYRGQEASLRPEPDLVRQWATRLALSQSFPEPGLE